MEKWLQRKISKVEDCFPQTFINGNNELILHKRDNIYFRIDNIESELDFDCKVLAYCSRPASKSLYRSSKVYFKMGLETYFDREFTQYQLDLIYTYLGNDIRRWLCRTFINQGFDYKLLEEQQKIKVLSEKGII